MTVVFLADKLVHLLSRLVTKLNRTMLVLLKVLPISTFLPDIKRSKAYLSNLLYQAENNSALHHHNSLVWRIAAANTMPNLQVTALLRV
jgi:hypothetical protein